MAEVFRLPCGHAFCKECLRDSQKCHICRQDVLTTGPAWNIRDMIRKKQCKCPHEECTWRGIYSDLVDSHIPKNCGFQQVACGNGTCTYKCKRRAMGSHALVCPHAEVACLCSSKVARADMADHTTWECPLGDVVCPLDCGNSYKRWMIPQHMQMCDRVAEHCWVCGQLILKDQEESHKRSSTHQQELEEKSKILLRQFVPGLTMGKTFQNPHVSKLTVGSFTVSWELGQHTTEEIWSPMFNRLGGQWALKLTTQGDKKSVFLRLLSRPHRILVQVSLAQLLPDGEPKKIQTCHICEMGDDESVGFQVEDNVEKVSVCVVQFEAGLTKH